MLRNMVTSLFKHERIRTTDAKAKELRRWADNLITLAKRGDLHARRQALSIVREKDVVHKLFEEAAERYGRVSGGYTRVVKLGRRPGDAAPISLVELMTPEKETKKKKRKKKVTPAVEKKAVVEEKESAEEKEADEKKAVVEDKAPDKKKAAAKKKAAPKKKTVAKEKEAEDEPDKKPATKKKAAPKEKEAEEKSEEKPVEKKKTAPKKKAAAKKADPKKEDADSEK
jgi:large subunit ribosomal protein L17